MPNAIKLSGVSKQYSHFALDQIELNLPEGEVMGLVGVNGAGKTTLLRILVGLIYPDAGDVEVLGFSMPKQQAAAKMEIGFASEDMRLYSSMSLRWHLDFVQSIYPGWDESYAQHLLQRFDLKAEQKLLGFSHGQRVKAMLLLILARRPRLLLLDEPTTGLDPVARAEVLEALADVLRDERRSVLFSSHNTHDIEQLCDSISFLHQGRLLATESKDGFLDRWRRILCQGQWPSGAAKLPEIASVRQSGSTLELKAREYSEALLEKLKRLGLQISRVETMSLEDIFIASVRTGVTQ